MVCAALNWFSRAATTKNPAPCRVWRLFRAHILWRLARSARPAGNMGQAQLLRAGGRGDRARAREALYRRDRANNPPSFPSQPLTATVTWPLYMARVRLSETHSAGTQTLGSIASGIANFGPRYCENNRQVASKAIEYATI